MCLRVFGTDEPFTLDARELRGKTSHGMLGSSRELDFADDHSGILVLDTEAAAGTALADVYDLNDVIIEVENKSLTHRPDMFGMLGAAREIAGIQHVKFSSPDWFADNSNPVVGTDELPLNVVNKVPELVPRITALALSGIEIKDSPIIIQSYLRRLGVKPINNIVDATNYTMLLTGQPLHAFDYDKVAEMSGEIPTIMARFPEKGEKIALLDGRTIEPHEKAVMISTDEQLLSVGGAIGGSDSEVDEKTTKIIIEAANFDLYSIRRTSMQHGIFTDAVSRYIRGQDPASCAIGSNFGAKMMQELSGADIASERKDSFDRPREIRTVLVKVERANTLLGTNLSGDEMVELLANVELEVNLLDDEIAVVAPTWRPDLNIAEDIIEEIGRLHGYGNIDASLPQRSIKAVALEDLEKTKRSLRSKLVSAGCE